MSGHKRRLVSISEDEYRRLHEAEMKLRSSVENSRVQAEAFRLESEQALWEQMQQTQARQRSINESLANMGGSLRQVEDENYRLLTILERDLYQSLENSASNILGHTNQMLDGWAERIDEQIQMIERRLHDGFAEVVQYSEDQEQNKRAASHEWIQTASQYLSMVENVYILDNQGQEDLNHLESQLSQAEQNFQNGFYESAITLAQQCYLAASWMRILFEKREQERGCLSTLAILAVEELQQSIDDAQVCQAMDLTGQLLPVQINIDYWTAGELSRLQERVSEIWLWLNDGHPHNNEDLKRLSAVDVPELKVKLDEMIFLARWEAISSQLRINIADIAVQALEEQGFDLVDAGYSNQDQRAGYAAYVLDYGGNQVQICVEPRPGITGSNELHIYSDDAGERTEHELVRRDSEISQALIRHGLHVQGERSNHRTPVKVSEDRASYTASQPGKKLDYT